MRSAASWILALAFAVPALSWGDDLTPEKQADIRRLIGVTGGARLATQFADATARSMTATLRKSRADIPERFYAVVNRELTALFQERMDTPGGLVERIVAIYHKHFTHAEVKELLAFYQTPIGRKTTEVLPAVMSESMAAGQAQNQVVDELPDHRDRCAAAAGD